LGGEFDWQVMPCRVNPLATSTDASALTPKSDKQPMHLHEVPIWVLMRTRPITKLEQKNRQGE
jgi:hypothetical protein